MRRHDVTRKSRWHGEILEPWRRESSPVDRIIPWQGWEWLVVVGLFILTVSTRWPLRVSSLEDLDSENYALAVQEFNGDHRALTGAWRFRLAKWSLEVARNAFATQQGAATARVRSYAPLHEEDSMPLRAP